MHPAARAPAGCAPRDGAELESRNGELVARRSAGAARRPAPARETDPRLRLVRRRSRKLVRRRPHRLLAPATTLGLVSVAVLIFAILLEQVMLSQSAFDLTRLRERLEAAEDRHQRLTFEAARLDDPERIEDYARDRLGMILPEDVRFMVADIPALRDGSRPMVAGRRMPAAATLTAGAAVGVDAASPVAAAGAAGRSGASGGSD